MRSFFKQVYSHLTTTGFALLSIMYASQCFRDLDFATSPYLWGFFSLATLGWFGLARGQLTVTFVGTLAILVAVEWLNNHGRFGFGAALFCLYLLTSTWQKKDKRNTTIFVAYALLIVLFVSDLTRTLFSEDLSKYYGTDTALGLMLGLGLGHYFSTYNFASQRLRHLIAFFAAGALLLLLFSTVWIQEEKLELLGRSPHIVFSELYGSLHFLGLATLLLTVPLFRLKDQKVYIGFVATAIFISLTQLPLPEVSSTWLFDIPFRLVSHMSTFELLFGLGTGWREWIRETISIGARFMELQYPLSGAVSLFLQYGMAGFFSVTYSVWVMFGTSRTCTRWVVLFISLILWFLIPLFPAVFFFMMAIMSCVRNKDAVAAPQCSFDGILVRTGVLVCSVSFLWMLFQIGASTISFFSTPRFAQPQRQLDVPQHLVQQLIVAEDVMYFEHRGVDLAQLKSALERTVGSGSLGRGGSTITMQLAKMLFLDYEKSLSRKVKQVWLSVLLELSYTKTEILNWYLSSMEFLAPNGLGIEAAAQHYFGKAASQLTQRESIALVLSIENPYVYNPAITPLPTHVRKRRRNIESRMLFWDRFLASFNYDHKHT